MISWYYYVFATRQCWRRHYIFWLSVCHVRPFVCSTGQVLLPRYLVNGSSSLDDTYMEYSLSPNDDLIRFWRSKVKGRRGGKGIHVWASKLKAFARYCLWLAIYVLKGDVKLQLKGKGKEAYLYSAFYILCISQSAQAWITEFYLQIHYACLSFLSVRQMAPPLIEVRDI